MVSASNLRFPRAHCATLSQLRSGFSLFMKDYRHCIGSQPSPECPKCADPCHSVPHLFSSRGSQRLNPWIRVSQPHPVLVLLPALLPRRGRLAPANMPCLEALLPAWVPKPIPGPSGIKPGLVLLEALTLIALLSAYSSPCDWGYSKSSPAWHNDNLVPFALEKLACFFFPPLKQPWSSTTSNSLIQPCIQCEPGFPPWNDLHHLESCHTRSLVISPLTPGSKSMTRSYHPATRFKALEAASEASPTPSLPDYLLLGYPYDPSSEQILPTSLATPWVL